MEKVNKQINPFYTIFNPNFTIQEKLDYQNLYKFIISVHPDKAPLKEMQNYGRECYKRILYTYSLLNGKKTGKCLEIGSNPYFMTMLLKMNTNFELTLTNYFGENYTGPQKQKIIYSDPKTNIEKNMMIEFDHFNIEGETFPYDSNSFDVVLFCEVIEHLLNDPQKVLLEIKRVLKLGGILILTTPNVARLENIARLISGSNIYDPYSGYGSYGRHNREYNRHELYMLLSYIEFEFEYAFTADVHANKSDLYFDPGKLYSIINNVPNRIYDLGQYIFIRAVNKRLSAKIYKKPSFLYRSYPPKEQIEL